MLCTPVFIFKSGSSALLGRPHCGLSSWLSLLAITQCTFLSLYHFRKQTKHEKTPQFSYHAWYKNSRCQLLGMLKAGSHVRRKHKRKDVHTSEISISTRTCAGTVFRLGTVNFFLRWHNLWLFFLCLCLCLRHPGSHVRRNDASISASARRKSFLFLALALASSRFTHTFSAFSLSPEIYHTVWRIWQ